MQKINFKNLPDTSTPLNAENLNLMQDNIETAINSIELMGGGDEVGTVKMFSGSTAPQGWLICDGSAISRTEYAELFSAIGTTYGSGNGTTTFNIPNIKGRTVVGLDSNDTDFNTLGNTLGEKAHTLTESELPSMVTIRKNRTNGSGNTEWREVSGWANYQNSSTGDLVNQPHNIIQPSIVLNYIIKASATTITQGQIIDSLDGDSTTDAPSVHATKLLNTYSTDEIKIGTWIDGKPLYRKFVDFGVLPDDSYKEINININNGNIVKFDSYAKNNTLGSTIKTDQYQNDTSVIRTSLYNDKIRMTTYGNWSAWNGYVILEYTKTTD